MIDPSYPEPAPPSSPQQQNGNDTDWTLPEPPPLPVPEIENDQDKFHEIADRAAAGWFSEHEIGKARAGILTSQLKAHIISAMGEAHTLGWDSAMKSCGNQIHELRAQVESLANVLDEISTTGADTLDGYDAANIATSALARFNDGVQEEEDGYSEFGFKHAPQ